MYVKYKKTCFKSKLRTFFGQNYRVVTLRNHHTDFEINKTILTCPQK